MKRFGIPIFLCAACFSDEGDSSLSSDGSGTIEPDTGDAGTDSADGGNGGDMSGGDGGNTTGDDSQSGSGTGADAGGTETGTSDGAETGNDSTSDGGGTGGAGMMKFPGDKCDPFIDWCTDSYSCQRWFEMRPGTNEYDTIFQCLEFNDLQGNGEYGSPCSFDSDSQCETGYMCTNAGEFPMGLCSDMHCCAPLCAYGEMCGDGTECDPVLWQALLADYLDKYTGIGSCAGG